ncbi:MAG TPA: type II secretion system F family protein [Tepidisphaeraceae bacterium]|jgi:type IV pilus assembly protein PilC|nr:type II secretion system F family protein [Tepidisphaeraceae bacterium]
MPTYRYESKDKSGKVQAGVLNAANLAAASAQLRARGEYILSLAPADDPSLKKKKGFNLDISLGPSQKDIQNFTSQLAVMIRAGISIRAAIEGIADQAENPKFKKMLIQMKKDVESGKQFSDALMRYPKVFSPLYINMVKASELSGGFSKMLDKIATYLMQQIETASMVRGAMIYPGIIGTLAIGTTIFLLTFVLPRFMIIFKGKENALPAPTKLLLALSDFMTNYWYICLGALVAGIWGFVLMLRTDWGRLWFDKMKLTVPIFKKLFRALYISRGLHTMGQLINAGVPMLDTIQITAEISGNTLYRRMWRAVYGAVKQGKKISAPLNKSPLLPRSVVQMIGAGEESGKLGEVLDEVSEFYSRELKAVIKTCTAMIEPLMIVAMGSVVGFIAMSIILPIFKLSQLVK